ncbi:unnamed protein product [Cuscuta campestris]|uniref:FAR1 domain-containing protein n=1 Tax=Cuscuta campestris TaxID=132261 RepID=A0A484KTJ3_9ASTE|nr:unnamed protein product [Cuscuta campestris]
MSRGAVWTSANTINCLETNVDVKGEDEVIDNGLMGQCNVSLIENISDQQQSQECESFNVVDAMPAVGMRFKNYEALYNFYHAYAKKTGFPIRKRSSRKGNDGMTRSVTMTCGREGNREKRSKKNLNAQPTMQLGCTAQITATVDIEGACTISVVNLEHNHGLSPSKARTWRCNRKVPNHVKRRLEVNDAAGIPLHKSFNSTVVEAGGYDNLTFLEKDFRNYVEQVRRVKICAGEAMAIQAYFQKLQAQCDVHKQQMDELARKLQWRGLKKVAERGLHLEAIQV